MSWLFQSLKNIYVATTLIFIIWIAFLDSNNLLKHQRLNQKVRELEQQKKYYEDHIYLLHQDIEGVTDNPKALEKFAREKYFFKKPNEEVFVIEKQN